MGEWGGGRVSREGVRECGKGSVSCQLARTHAVGAASHVLRVCSSGPQLQGAAGREVAERNLQRRSVEGASSTVRGRAPLERLRIHKRQGGIGQAMPGVHLPGRVKVARPAIVGVCDQRVARLREALRLLLPHARKAQVAVCAAQAEGGQLHHAKKAGAREAKGRAPAANERRLRALVVVIGVGGVGGGQCRINHVILACKKNAKLRGVCVGWGGGGTLRGGTA